MKHIRFSTISLITLLAFPLLVLHSCKPTPNTVPIATFAVSPGYGGTDITFTYDASGVQDLEDPAEVLQVRWDWDSDSVFDTNFSTEKVATHQFALGGTFYTTVEVMDSDGGTDRYTDFVRVAWDNRDPTASFSVDPQNGFLQDVFTFDASSSHDAEDVNAELLVRWDFEGDGTWDTEYDIEKIATHQYDAAETYHPILEVKDSDEATGQATMEVTVGETNESPEVPYNPVPGNQVTDFSTACTLNWSCDDPEMDPLTYDIYFGTTDNPPKVASDVDVREYICYPLEYNSTYYWKVVSKDSYDHVVEGPVWTFSTNAPINEMGSFTDIRNGQVYKTVTIGERIWMAENLNIGTMIHASTGGDRNDGYQLDNGKAEKFCYNNDPAYCDIYGGLYQWDEAMAYEEMQGADGLCPIGWHLPTEFEWNELDHYYKDQGMVPGAELKLGSQSGFQGLFSGFMIFAEHKFYDLNQGGYFWSSTLNPAINHLGMGRSLFLSKTELQEDTFMRVSGLSVRCLKDY